jgi:beta-lactamase regulating signal transducer with metallopeptidase domain
MDVLAAAIGVSRPIDLAACLVWAVGAGSALGLMILRQRSFVRSLGTLSPSPDGTWRSSRVAEPMLIGALRPRVLVPVDFEQRYSVEEREFVLAHERAHMRRGDALVNAFGAAWLSVFWFNPLMFWAMRQLRLDQDLACDAAVLAAAGRGRRGRYAQALLKAQLHGETALSLPLACHWHSAHPLRRRVAALRRPVAGRLRHAIGILCVTTVVGSVTLAAHAVESARQTARPAASQAAKSIAGPTAHAGKVCPLSQRHVAARS